MKMTSVEARTQFMKILNDVRDNKIEIIITKRGVPVAKIVPVKKQKTKLGLGEGLGKTLGDIVNTDFSDEWESLQ